MTRKSEKALFVCFGKVLRFCQRSRLHATEVRQIMTMML